jgi:hypothetical protein
MDDAGRRDLSGGTAVVGRLTILMATLALVASVGCGDDEPAGGGGAATTVGGSGGTAGAGGSVGGTGGGTGGSAAGVPFQEMTCEALGLDSVSAATMEDADDELVLQKFLEHTQALPSSLTESYCQSMTAQPEDIKWQVVPQIRMALVSYKLTGDSQYLDIFVEVMDNLRSTLITGPDGYLGWYGKALDLFQSPDNPDVDVIITSFGVADLLAQFVQIVQCDAALASTYATQITDYLDLAESHLLPKWEERGNVVDVGTTGVIFRTHEDLRVDKGHLTQPHNKHSIIIHTYANLYAATGDSAYMQRAVQVGTRYKRSLTLQDGHYEWNYWDPSGAWDVHPDQPAEWKHWIGTEHTGGYYGLTLSQAVLLYHLGVVIDQDDLDRFLETQLEVAWNSDVDAPEWHKVDGSAPGSGEYISAALAPFSSLVEQYVFHGAKQAERVANADHGWQGGPVAAGYLEGKYWVLPHSGGQAMYTALGDGFRASAEGAALLGSLEFDVTGTGYAAPAAPADWPNMPPEP